MIISNLLSAVLKKRDGIKFLRLLSKKLNKYRLGDLLLSKGLINDLQLEYALLEQKRSGEKLGKILIKQGSISATELYYKLTEQWVIRAAVFGLAIFMQVLTPSITGAGALASPLEQSVQLKAGSNSFIENNHRLIFGFQEVRSDDISAFKKWTSMQSRYDDQVNSVMSKAPRVRLWQAALQNLKDKPKFEQITEVNNFFNNVKYIEDIDNYKKSDYWATPIEFLSRGGDCEDFAIAKYVSLLALGFKQDQLRISIVYDETKNLHHAVLMAYLEEGVFVLDNQNKKVANIQAVTNYKPIFSINSSSWWMYKKAGDA